MPPPIIIIGESHEDISSVEVLVEILPTLAKLGYVLCFETPRDKNVAEYISKIVEVRSKWSDVLKNFLPLELQESYNPENLRFDQIVALLKKYTNYEQRHREVIANAIVSLPHDLALKNLIEKAERLGVRVAGVDADAGILQEIARRTSGVQVSEQSMILERDEAIANNIDCLKTPVIFLGGLAHIEGLEQLLKKKNKGETTVLSYCITRDDKDMPNSIKKRFAPTINLLKENRGKAVKQIGEKITNDIQRKTTDDIPINTPESLRTSLQEIENADDIQRNITDDIQKYTEYLRARLQAIENKFKQNSGLSECTNASSSFFFHFKTYSERTKNTLQKQKVEFKQLVHELADQQETAEAKLVIYNEFKNSPVITTHRNGGLWAIGRTGSQIELDNEIDHLNNQVTKKS